MRKVPLGGSVFIHERAQKTCRGNARVHPGKRWMENRFGWKCYSEFWPPLRPAQSKYDESLEISALRMNSCYSNELTCGSRPWNFSVLRCESSPLSCFPHRKALSFSSSAWARPTRHCSASARFAWVSFDKGIKVFFSSHLSQRLFAAVEIFIGTIRSESELLEKLNCDRFACNDGNYLANSVA